MTEDGQPGIIEDQPFVADTKDPPEKYLDYQGQQFEVIFDVLIICNIIFHNDRVLLYHTTDDTKSWKNKIGVPMWRLSRPDDENDVGMILKSRVDRPMADDISVEEFSRVACRTQVGLDPVILQNSRAATALHTAVSPASLEDSVWLRASLLWKIEEVPDLVPDKHICRDIFFASAEEVDHLEDDRFLMGIKADIQTAFDLRLRRMSLA